MGPIAGFAFGPASVSIEVGDTVTWTDDDNALHTATASSDVDTGTMVAGDSAAGVVSSDPPSITPAPTDTVTAAAPDHPGLVVPLAGILATLGIGMVIGAYLTGRRGGATGD